MVLKDADPTFENGTESPDDEENMVFGKNIVENEDEEPEMVTPSIADALGAVSTLRRFFQDEGEDNVHVNKRFDTISTNAAARKTQTVI